MDDDREVPGSEEGGGRGAAGWICWIVDCVVRREVVCSITTWYTSYST